jgi:chemotaxis protein CheD
MSFNLVNVGIADIQIGRHPQILRTILGSCVGVCLYDPQERVTGMAHIMLPVMTTRATNPKKYADRLFRYWSKKWWPQAPLPKG